MALTRSSGPNDEAPERRWKHHAVQTAVALADVTAKTTATGPEFHLGMLPTSTLDSLKDNGNTVARRKHRHSLAVHSLLRSVWVQAPVSEAPTGSVIEFLRKQLNTRGQGVPLTLSWAAAAAKLLRGESFGTLEQGGRWPYQLFRPPRHAESSTSLPPIMRSSEPLSAPSALTCLTKRRVDCGTVAKH